LITSLRYKNPFKMYITQLQLLQFVCCIIHSFTVLLYENIVPKKYAYLELSYHMSMFFLFNNFYKKSYKKKTLYIDSEGR
jgi:elongation of very long chain fatty acids protein 7